MLKLRTPALFASILALPVAALAQRPKPSPTPTPVITAQLVHCSSIVDVVERDACHAVNRVQSDVNRPYSNGQEGVTIGIDYANTGNLTMNLQDSSRFSRLDLSHMAVQGNPQPVWTSTPQLVKNGYFIHRFLDAKRLSGCSTASTCEYNFVTNMNGGGFTIDGIYYRLQWNPDSVLQYINAGQPTSKVNINYRKDATGETYTITPLLNEYGYYLAGLQAERRKSVWFAGQYNIPFTFVVTIR